MPSLGYITFSAIGFDWSFTCLLGDGAPTPTWDPGWTDIPREKERSLTEWHGNNGLEMSIPILIDHFAVNNGIQCESDCRMLEKMSGQDKGQTEPPLIVFDSAGVVPHDSHDASHLEWFIKSVDWGDSDRNSVGNRTRQAATVVVKEFVSETALSNASAAQKYAASKAKAKKKAAAQRRAKQKQYVVKKGETLEHIAAMQLGKASRWHELKTLNPSIRDPKKALPNGTIIKMP
jgi:hypothetical protein